MNQGVRAIFKAYYPRRNFSQVLKLRKTLRTHCCNSGRIIMFLTMSRSLLGLGAMSSRKERMACAFGIRYSRGFFMASKDFQGSEGCKNQHNCSWDVVIQLSILWQNTQENELREGTSYSGLWVQRFQSMVDWLHCCWTVVSQSILAEKLYWSRATHLMVAGRQKEKGPGTRYSPMFMLQGSTPLN